MRPEKLHTNEIKVQKIVLRQSQTVDGDAAQETVKYIVSKRKGLIRSTNPCAIRKRVWRSEGINTQRERLSRNRRNAERRASKTETERDERLARAKESARRSRENRRKFVRADSTANISTIESASTVRIYQVNRYIRESKHYVYEHSVLQPGEAPLTGRVYHVMRKTVIGRETVKLVPEEEPVSSDGSSEGASEGASSG